jgi:hypothetical protein
VTFEPDEAAPGSIADLVLHVPNERDDATTTKVQMRFWPEDLRLVVVKLPTVAGWSGTVDGGEVGGAPAQGITWTRPASSPQDNPELPFTIGPLPTEPGPLEFKVVQTYSNGDADDWIQSTPPGGPEPEFPAPVVELRPGAPGRVPTSTIATTVAPTTTVASSPTTVISAQTEENEDDDDNAAVWIIGAIGVAIAVAIAATLWLRSRRTA